MHALCSTYGGPSPERTWSCLQSLPHTPHPSAAVTQTSSAAPSHSGGPNAPITLAQQTPALTKRVQRVHALQRQHAPVHHHQCQQRAQRAAHTVALRRRVGGVWVASGWGEGTWPNQLRVRQFTQLAVPNDRCRWLQSHSTTRIPAQSSAHQAKVLGGDGCMQCCRPGAARARTHTHTNIHTCTAGTGGLHSCAASPHPTTSCAAARTVKQILAQGEESSAWCTSGRKRLYSTLAASYTPRCTWGGEHMQGVERWVGGVSRSCGQGRMRGRRCGRRCGRILVSWLEIPAISPPPR